MEGCVAVTGMESFRTVLQQVPKLNGQMLKFFLQRGSSILNILINTKYHYF